jgi:hypothetical protein
MKRGVIQPIAILCFALQCGCVGREHYAFAPLRDETSIVLYDRRFDKKPVAITDKRCVRGIADGVDRLGAVWGEEHAFLTDVAPEAEYSFSFFSRGRANAGIEVYGDLAGRWSDAMYSGEVKFTDNQRYVKCMQDLAHQILSRGTPSSCGC